MKSTPICLACAGLLALGRALLPAQEVSLTETPVWHLEPGDRPYLTVGYDEQGMAYNPQTGHLLLVHGRDGNESVFVIDAENGDHVGELSVQGLSGGVRLLRKIVVDSEGVIYAGNLTGNSRQDPYRIYRWADEAAAPELLYQGDPSNGVTGALTRYGDNLSIRGSGEDTEILVVPDFWDQNLVAVRVAARFRYNEAGDALVGEFSVYDTPTTFGLGVDFGPGETFWGTRAAQPLREFDFDGNVLRQFDGSIFASGISPIRIDVERDLLAGVIAGTSDVYLYRLSDLSETDFNAPLGVGNFHADNLSIEGTGEIAFAENRLFALGTNNGLAAFELLVPGPVLPGDLYWTNSGTLRTADLADGDPRYVAWGLSRPIGVAVDSAAGQVYWAEDQGNRIVRSALDGTEVTEILTDRILPQFLAVDPGAGRLYWTEWTRGLFYADLDGADPTHLIDQDTNWTSGLAVDPLARQIYMASAANGEIFRIDSDGAGLATVVTFEAGVYGLAADPVDRLLYATNFETGTLRRHGLDTGITEILYADLEGPLGVTLSAGRDTLYWVERTGGRVKTAPADGSASPEILFEGESSPFGIALHIAPEGETFAQWILAQGVPEGLRGPGDDPDGDGVPNLLEFALDLSPLTSSVDRLPVPFFETVDGAAHLALAVEKNSRALGVDYVIEVSGNLREWHLGEGEVTIIEETAETLRVRDNVPADGTSRRFIRLRAVLVP